MVILVKFLRHVLAILNPYKAVEFSRFVMWRPFATLAVRNKIEFLVSTSETEKFLQNLAMNFLYDIHNVGFNITLKYTSSIRHWFNIVFTHLDGVSTVEFSGKRFRLIKTIKKTLIVNEYRCRYKRQIMWRWYLKI